MARRRAVGRRTARENVADLVDDGSFVEYGPTVIAAQLEGAVRLGFRKELDAIDDPEERERSFQDRVDKMYEHGKALNTASYFEIDDVIDPADTRRWISAILRSSLTPQRVGKKRPNIDTW